MTPLHRRLPVLWLAVATAACGGSPAGPTILPTSQVTLVFFIDENGNGTLDGGESLRVPGIDAALGSSRAVSEAGSGRATLAGVTDGAHPLQVLAAPPFFVAPRGYSVQAPQPAGEVAVPVALPIGSNQARVYMAFGDSITNGDGSSDDGGYRTRLQPLLASHFGGARVLDEGVPGTRSNQGATRIGASLAFARPGYTLIVYGTNDWNHCARTVPCFTIDSLRTIVRQTRAAGSLPFLATIIPANPLFGDRFAEDRNFWAASMNDLIRPLAQAEGAVLVDLNKAFVDSGDLTLLFDDAIHPNDAGYQLMAQTFFRAISGALPVSASANTSVDEPLPPQ